MMTKEQMRIWTHRHCKFAVIGRTSEVIVARLEQAGFHRLTGLQVIRVLLAALEPYVRRLSEEQRQRLLESLLNIAAQMRGVLSVQDLRIRLPKVLRHLNIPFNHLQHPEMRDLLDEVIQTLSLKGRDVARPRSVRDTEWEALRHVSDPLRFQPRPSVQRN